MTLEPVAHTSRSAGARMPSLNATSRPSSCSPERDLSGIEGARVGGSGPLVRTSQPPRESWLTSTTVVVKVMVTLKPKCSSYFST